MAQNVPEPPAYFNDEQRALWAQVIPAVPTMLQQTITQQILLEVWVVYVTRIRERMADPHTNINSINMAVAQLRNLSNCLRIDNSLISQHNPWFAAGSTTQAENVQDTLDAQYAVRDDARTH